jgi:hypothetical protein
MSSRESLFTELGILYTADRHRNELRLVLGAGADPLDDPIHCVSCDGRWCYVIRSGEGVENPPGAVN